MPYDDAAFVVDTLFRQLAYALCCFSRFDAYALRHAMLAFAADAFAAAAYVPRLMLFVDIICLCHYADYFFAIF